MDFARTVVGDEDEPEGQVFDNGLRDRARDAHELALGRLLSEKRPAGASG
jgi:hypothetical protein